LAGRPSSSRCSSAPQLCIEPLLREGPTGQIYPWLAESYKVADDLKSISFTLRKGVKFHDGTDFNAASAKWNLQNQIDAKRTPYWTSIDIIDDLNIRVNLNQWLNTNVRVFADGQSSMMVSKAAFDKNGLDWMRQNPWVPAPSNLSASPAMSVLRPPASIVIGRKILPELNCLIWMPSISCSCLDYTTQKRGYAERRRRHGDHGTRKESR